MSVSVAPTPDKGRRRRLLDDEGEDEDVEASPVVTRPSECESEGETPDVELSEHESAVDENADQEDETEEGSETETEEGSETESESGSETETEGGEGYSDEEGLEEERQSGDGEEQPNSDKPDDDEDKKNPAYVPRKGAFYEHDFRQGDEGPEGVEEKDDSKPKKKLWQDEGKWSHDRYSDDLQAPKSREELIAIYGYDIRAADKPPEAAPKRPSREKGPRKHRIQDFIPQMAVIDTTEDGSDSVPNLGDEELILYDGPPSRNANRSHVRNTDSRRGGRGRTRVNVAGEVENYNNRNREDANQYKNEKNSTDNRISSDNSKPEEIQSAEEFPSLEDTEKTIKQRENQGGKRTDNYEKLKSDTTKFLVEKSPKTYPTERDGNQRKDYRDNRGGKIQQSQDARRQDDVRENNRYQQGYRDERKDVNIKSGGRDSDFYNRGPEENWRSAPNEHRESYNRGDDYRRGGKQNFGYGRQQQQQYRDNRGPRAGNSGDGYFNYNNRGNRYEQPPRYQQQVDVASPKEPREYTNTSYKSADDKTKQRQSYNGASPNVANVVTDGGDGSTSQNVVFSNKENVQTINVTITSTTTEKKSYAKERRAKGSSSKPIESATIMGNTEMQKPVVQGSGMQYQVPSQSNIKVDPNSIHQAGAKRYSSQRQQTLVKGVYSEPPPMENSGAKLYNPALPPPSYFRDHGSVNPGQHPTPSSPGVQDPTHYPPPLLPPAAALPYGLPVSTTVLPLPPSAPGIANPALFQPTTGPPPVGTGILGSPYLPAGMMYGAAPRVPPPGTPAGFPMSIAYTSPPPPAAAVAAAVVGNQPPPQGTVQQPGIQSAQHKKVYRGDITYYAPELQQPSRTPQKRPKAAIPIIDPQEMRRQKQKSEQRVTPEKSPSVSTNKPVLPPTPTSNSNSKGISPAQTLTTDTAIQPTKGAPNAYNNSYKFVAESALPESSSIATKTTIVQCNPEVNLDIKANEGEKLTDPVTIDAVNVESSDKSALNLTTTSYVNSNNVTACDTDAELKPSLSDTVLSFKGALETVETVSLTKDAVSLDIKNEMVSAESSSPLVNSVQCTTVTEL